MKLFWITLLISSLVSCHNFKEDRQLSFALERAGENRRELEQVLEHYKNDSLKYRAACFLIKNMLIAGKSPTHIINKLTL